MMIGRVIHNWLKKLGQLYCPVRKVKSTFSSSFIQYWYCQDWDFDRWIEEFQMLQKIGINEVILQNIADTKSHYAVYPTKIEGYTSNPNDMVETALCAAESVGMNVRIGLGFNDGWWSLEAQDREWLDYEAAVNEAIVTEITTLYGGHQALAGWYIPYEFHPLRAITNDQQTSMNRFFKEIAKAIKSCSSKSIMIAPFYNARLSEFVTLTLWSNLVHKILRDTGIDILALQDSIGVGFNAVADLDEIFAYTKKATDRIGMILYAITETFVETSAGNLPATQSRIQQQLFRTSAYVHQHVAFSISHYQNANEPAQIDGYEDYYRYFRSCFEN